MTKRFKQPALIAHIADGKGGLRRVEPVDLTNDDWTIERRVPGANAAEWMAHWTAAADSRDWSYNTQTQLTREFNTGTGTLILLPTNPGASRIEYLWERNRHDDLMFRVRPSGTSAPTNAVVEDFVSHVEWRLQHNFRERLYRRSYFEYNDGLPWTGEVWLSDLLRLGPPSQFPESWLGPQIVIIDLSFDAIGRLDNTGVHRRTLRDLRTVLSPWLGEAFREPSQPFHVWITEPNVERTGIECRMATKGYTELSAVSKMPSPGTSPAMPLVEVTRPGLERFGISSDDHCVKVPSDLLALWKQFELLAPALREQYLRACNSFCIAQSMFPDQRTAYAAFLVVACEALKPYGRAFEKATVYDVVATLLDPKTALHLKSLAVPPQRVRSDHVHRGDVFAGEFVGGLSQDVFADPSFDEMLRQLLQITRMCLIEWLRNGGIARLTWLPRPATKPKSKTSAKKNRHLR